MRNSIPKLANDIKIIKNGGRDYVIRKGIHTFRLTEKNAAICRILIKLVKKRKGRRVIYKKLVEDHSPSEVIDFLKKYGTILLEPLNRELRGKDQEKQKYRITIIGKNPFSYTLRRALKQQANIKVKVIRQDLLNPNSSSLAKTDLYVCLPGLVSYENCVRLVALCQKGGIPCFFVSVDKFEILLGPSYVPGISACFLCSRRQLDKLENKNQKFFKIIRSDVLKRKKISRLFDLAIPKIVLETEKLLGIIQERFAYIQSLESLTPTSAPAMLLAEKMMPLPDCPLCHKEVGKNNFTQTLQQRLLVQMSFARPQGRPESLVKPNDSSYENHPDQIKTVGIVGGGTAGYLTALALKKRYPKLEVSLIESPSIPIIGVGEATTPLLNFFLFRLLQFDMAEFYRMVRPTWKLGIRFFWGLPDDYYFNHPFGLADIYPAMKYGDGLNEASLNSIMMSTHTSPVLKDIDGTKFHSILHRVPHALHLDNQLFVSFLQEKAKSWGVKYVNAVISEVILEKTGDEVLSLKTQAGSKLAFDFYIDCSGFTSLLMGKALKSPFVSYESSLFTDRAVVANTAHGGSIKPYTMADTMQNGWTWGIPLRDSIHRGYVYSSAFCSDDAALAEMKATYPNIGEARFVKFRSGRHQDFWKGNVAAIGNAYGFVEPLESTGIHMIIQEVMDLVKHFPKLKTDTGRRALLNQRTNDSWDFLRWFLAIHYKYNRKMESPFWNACQNETNISGVSDLIQLYSEAGPLSYQNDALQELMQPFKEDIIFGPFGFDLMLMGQGIVPGSRIHVADDGKTWKNKRRIWLDLIRSALPQEQALEVLDRYPNMLG